MHLARDDDVDVSQEGQVERARDEVVLVEDDGAAVVALLEGLEDPRGGVVLWRAAGGDVAASVLVAGRRVGLGLPRTVWGGFEGGSLRDRRGAASDGRAG